MPCGGQGETRGHGLMAVNIDSCALFFHYRLYHNKCPRSQPLAAETLGLYHTVSCGVFSNEIATVLFLMELDAARNCSAVSFAAELEHLRMRSYQLDTLSYRIVFHQHRFDFNS